MDNLDAVLKAHGSSLDHTVKFNLYVSLDVYPRSSCLYPSPSTSSATPLSKHPPITRWRPVSIRAVPFANLRSLFATRRRFASPDTI
jgi:hypothetical protein